MKCDRAEMKIITSTAFQLSGIEGCVITIPDLLYANAAYLNTI